MTIRLVYYSEELDTESQFMLKKILISKNLNQRTVSLQ